MHARWLTVAALAASGLFSACLLGEAQKVEGGTGAGNTGGGTSGPTTTSTMGPGGGSGGMGGAGGMPPTCTSDTPGEVAWSLAFSDSPQTMNMSRQQILQLAEVPEGVLVAGQYVDDLEVLATDFESTGLGGNAFLAWITPDGTFALDTNQSKRRIIYGGNDAGPPMPRGVFVRDDRFTVVGSVMGELAVPNATALNTSAGDRQAFLADHDQATTAELFGGFPTRDQFDDVVVTSRGEVIVSGYTEGGLTIGGNKMVEADRNYIASPWAATPWVIQLPPADTAVDSVHLALGQNDRLFIAASLAEGTGMWLNAPYDVDPASAFMLAAIDLNGNKPSTAQARIFQGNSPNGNYAFARDIAVGQDGAVAIVGAFFGQIVLDGGAGNVVSTSAGQLDGFAVVFDPATLVEVNWAKFGSDQTGVEVVWSAEFDPCGDLAIIGSITGPTTIGTTLLSPQGTSPAFVAKLERIPGNDLAVKWVTLFDDPAHLPCAPFDSPSDRKCYHVVATEAGVYAAGGFSGSVTLGTQTLTTAGTEDDAYLVKLSP